MTLDELEQELATRRPRRFTLAGEILEGEPLTERELEVLRCAAVGLNARETGLELYLATETVRSYRKRITGKLGARNLVHAVSLSLRSRLIS